MTESLAATLQQFGATEQLTATLNRAEAHARERQHRTVTLEHLLFALCDDPDASLVLQACQINFEKLRADASGYLERMDARLPPGVAAETEVHGDLIRIFRVASAAAEQRQRAPSGGLVLAAIVGDGRSPAANMLRNQGLTFDEAVRALQQANARLKTPAPQQAEVPTATPPEPAPPQQQSNTLEPIVAPRGSDPMPPPPQHPVAASRPSPASNAPDPGVSQPGNAAPAISGQQLTTADATRRILDDARRKVEQSRPVLRTPDRAKGQEDERDVLARLERPPSARANPDPKPNPTPKPARAPQTQMPRAEPARAQPPLGSPPPVRPPETAKTPQSGPAIGGDGALPIRPDQLPQRVPIKPPQPSEPPRPPVAQAPPALRADSGQAPSMPPATTPHRASALEHPGSAAGDQHHRQDRDRVKTLQQADFAKEGRLARGIPKTMTLEETEVVEVRIARHEIEAVTASGQDPSSRELVVAKAMTLRLRAPDGDFFVEPETPETHWIENRLGRLNDDQVIWRWAVTPIERGEGVLQLIVGMRTVAGDGQAMDMSVPDETIDVRVVGYKPGLAGRLFTGVVLLAIGAAAGFFAEDLSALVAKFTG